MWFLNTVQVKWTFLPWEEVRDASQEEQRPFRGLWSLVLYFTTATKIWTRLGCSWRVWTEFRFFSRKRKLYILTLYEQSYWSRTALNQSGFIRTDSLSLVKAELVPHLILKRLQNSDTHVFSRDPGTSVGLQIRAWAGRSVRVLLILTLCFCSVLFLLPHAVWERPSTFHTNLIPNNSA